MGCSGACGESRARRKLACGDQGSYLWYRQPPVCSNALSIVMAWTENERKARRMFWVQRGSYSLIQPVSSILRLLWQTSIAEAAGIFSEALSLLSVHGYHVHPSCVSPWSSKA